MQSGVAVWFGPNVAEIGLTCRGSRGDGTVFVRLMENKNTWTVTAAKLRVDKGEVKNLL